MKKVERRDFLKKAAVATAVGGATLFGYKQAPYVQAQETYQMRMVTTWPPHFPDLGESADLISHWVDSMSNGRLLIQVYGGGELVPPFEVFDAVSQGVVQMGHGAAYYWAGKIPASALSAF